MDNKVLLRVYEIEKAQLPAVQLIDLVNKNLNVEVITATWGVGFVDMEATVMDPNKVDERLRSAINSRVRREFNVEANIGKPQVSYR